MTLADLVEEYGRASERVGELRAEILHRARMLSVLTDPSTVEDPPAPLAPLPRETPQRTVRTGTHRETFERVLAEAGQPVPMQELIASARAYGYASNDSVARQTLRKMVAKGQARRVSHGVYAAMNGYQTHEVTT